MTDEEVLYFIHEAFAQIQCDDSTKDLKVFPNQDGLPFFEFVINGQNGGKFKITYAFPVLYFRELAERAIGTQSFKKQGLTDFRHAEAIQTIRDYAVYLMRAIEASFRQATSTVPILVEKFKALNDQQRNERAARFWTQSTTGFSFDKASNEMANEFAENQKRSSKDLFLKVAPFLRDELPHKRVLFSIYYEHYKRTWRDAKKLYTKIKDRPDWRTIIIGAHAELPLDLVEKFAARKGEEKSPADLALIHSARMCEVDENSARSTLNLYRKESEA
jgi:hypothetical protein